MKKTYESMIKKCIAVSVLFLALPLAGFGETGIGENVLSIGPRATYAVPKDADEGQWFVGAQARMHLSPNLGLEGSVDYLSNKFDRFTTIKTYPVQVSLLVYLVPGSVLSPYLIGGPGWYYTQVSGPFDLSITSNRFGLHAGAGAEIMLNDNLSLDGSYRYVWLESVTSKDLNALDKTYQDSGSMFTIALNFLF